MSSLDQRASRLRRPRVGDEMEAAQELRRLGILDDDDGEAYCRTLPRWFPIEYRYHYMEQGTRRIYINQNICIGVLSDRCDINMPGRGIVNGWRIEILGPDNRAWAMQIPMLDAEPPPELLVEVRGALGGNWKGWKPA